MSITIFDLTQGYHHSAFLCTLVIFVYSLFGLLTHLGSSLQSFFTISFVDPISLFYFLISTPLLRSYHFHLQALWTWDILCLCSSVSGPELLLFLYSSFLLFYIYAIIGTNIICIISITNFSTWDKLVIHSFGPYLGDLHFSRILPELVLSSVCSLSARWDVFWTACGPLFALPVWADTTR